MLIEKKLEPQTITEGQIMVGTKSNEILKILSGLNQSQIKVVLDNVERLLLNQLILPDF